MNISIVGSARLLDTGVPQFPLTIGQGAPARTIWLYLRPEEAQFINATEPYLITAQRVLHMVRAHPHRPEPHLIADLSKPGLEWYLFRGKCIKVEANGTYLSESEIKLEVANAVLKHEKRYQQLQRQLDAFSSIERADSERRERIPDDVRIFVWQRDEGKCVRCGSNERLEFDHIIPVVKGGSSTERNIQLLCERCNREKGTRL
jgi:5-methylcytosine-specific restriction endonuclease McrA